LPTVMRPTNSSIRPAGTAGHYELKRRQPEEYEIVNCWGQCFAIRGIAKHSQHLARGFPNGPADPGFAGFGLFPLGLPMPAR
jgi:hypothetical protein